MYRYKLFAAVLLAAGAIGTGSAVAQVIPPEMSAQIAPSHFVPMIPHQETTAHQVKAAQNYVLIYLKGKKLPSLPVSVDRGITSVSVANVVPVLRQLGWHVVYNQPRQRLELQVHDYKGKLLAQGKGLFQVTANGKLFLKTELLSGRIPLTVWRQLLLRLGVHNEWNASQRVWQIEPVPKAVTITESTDTNQPPVGSTSGMSPNTVLNTFNSNDHTNDQGDWQSYNQDLYVSAQTNDPSASGTKGTPLLNAAPNQALYLFAFSDSMDVHYQDVTWRVNSPDATITTVSQAWEMGSHQTTEATFVATKPGIYTVQAMVNGSASVPLVLTIGMNQLQSTPFTSSASQTGIMPLPTNLPKQSPITQAGVTYYTYPAEGNWIPVSGSTKLPISAMSVVITGSGAQEWTYRLPITNGDFSGLLEVPFTGNLNVTLFPDYFATLSKATQDSSGKYYMPLSNYEVQVSGQNLDSTTTSLLASAQRDYNMSSKFAQTASVLLENSPSLDTAIAAIANDASDSLTYNQQELQTVNYLWQDSWSAWQKGQGVCEDYATLAAALLDSVAIPTQTVGGWANPDWTTPPASDNNPVDAHEWDQAWDGSRWIPIDPTWNAGDQANVSNSVSSQYFGATNSFAATHLAVPSQTGQDY